MRKQEKVTPKFAPWLKAINPKFKAAKRQCIYRVAILPFQTLS